MRFLLVNGALLAKLFRFLAVIVFFVGASLTGAMVLFATPFMDDNLGIVITVFIVGSWIFFAFLSYGFLMLMSQAADYIYTKSRPMMESGVDERG